MNGSNPSAAIPLDEKTHRIVIERSQGWSSVHLRAVWEYRELLYFLVWRDVKVRYKQTALGILWIIFQPVITMVVFSYLFGALLGVPSGDRPYPVFSFVALLPWTYFANSLAKASASLVSSSHLITKVYFPRLVIPIAGVLSGLVDFGLSFLVLIGMLLVYKIPLSVTALALPGFLLLAVLAALGFGLWLSALNVRFRDVQYLVPFLTQLWMYLTPVFYGVTLLPPAYRFLLALNPLTAVIEGFRWALLGGPTSLGADLGWSFLLSIAITLIVFFSGAIFFRRTERTFADVI